MTGNSLYDALIDKSFTVEKMSEENILTSEEKAFAAIIADEILQNNMKAYYLESDIQMKLIVVMAYIYNYKEKIDKLRNKYLTEPDFKSTFEEMVKKTLLLRTPFP